MDGTKGEYLRNIVLQYMTAADADVRSRMEAAVSQILHFNPAGKAAALRSWCACPARLATGSRTHSHLSCTSVRRGYAEKSLIEARRRKESSWGFLGV